MAKARTNRIRFWRLFGTLALLKGRRVAYSAAAGESSAREYFDCTERRRRIKTLCLRNNARFARRERNVKYLKL